MLGEVIKIGEYNVTIEADLIGIHYWIQLYRHRVPAFEIFEYLGRDTARNAFFFQARNDKAILIKRGQELAHDTADFKPFLLDVRKIEAILP